MVLTAVFTYLAIFCLVSIMCAYVLSQKGPSDSMSICRYGVNQKDLTASRNYALCQMGRTAVRTIWLYAVALKTKIWRRSEGTQVNKLLNYFEMQKVSKVKLRVIAVVNKLNAQELAMTWIGISYGYVIRFHSFCLDNCTLRPLPA